MGPTRDGHHYVRPPNEQKSRTQKRTEMKSHTTGPKRLRPSTTMEHILMAHLSNQDTEDTPSRDINMETAIPISNQFDTLSESATSFASFDGDDDEVQVAQGPITPKNPPIIITSKNVTAINTICQEIVASKKYTLEILQRIGTRINVTNKNEYDLLRDALVVKGFEFFSYHTKDTKQKKIALKGLYLMNDDEIKSLLHAKNVVPDDVKALKLRHGNVLNILYFKHGAIKLGDLRKIESINQVRVRWEFFENRRHNVLPQCRNCQMFGHSSVNCRRKPRCLTCSDFHKTKDCTFRIPREQLTKMNPNTIDRSKVRCVNCGEQHTANYRGCTERKNYEDIQIRLQQKQNLNRPSLSYKTNNEYFPGLPRSSPQHSIPTRPSKQTYANITQTNRNLFTPEELGIIWKEMIFGLQHCKTKVDQALKLGEIITKYIYTLTP